MTDIFPLLVIGPPLTNSVPELDAIPTLVTVPPDPLPPPVELIVTLPFASLTDTTMLVPAIILQTPVFVIVTVFIFELALAVIPSPPVNVLYGLAHANRLAKLFTVLLNAA